MRNFVKVLLVGTVLASACVLLPNDVWAKVEKVQFANGKTLYKGANGHYYSTHKAAELKQGSYYTANETARRYGRVSSSGPVKLQTYVVNPNNGKGNMTVVNFYDDETSTTVNGNTYHRDASGGISQARYINYQGTQYEAGRQNITNAVNVTEAGGVLGRSWTVTTDPTKKNQSGYVYVESVNGAAKIYYPAQGTEGKNNYVPPSQVAVGDTGKGTVVARSYTDKSGNEIKVGMENRISADSNATASAYMGDNSLTAKANDGKANASVTLRPGEKEVSGTWRVESAAGKGGGSFNQTLDNVKTSQNLNNRNGSSSEQNQDITANEVTQTSTNTNNGKTSKTGQTVTADGAKQGLSNQNKTVTLETNARNETIIQDGTIPTISSSQTSAATLPPVPKGKYVVVNGGVYEVFTAGDSKTITVDGRSYTWDESKNKWDSGSFWHKDLVQQADVSAIMGDGSHLNDVKSVSVFSDGSSVVEFTNGSYVAQTKDGQTTGRYETGESRVGAKRTETGTGASLNENQVKAKTTSEDGSVGVNAKVEAKNGVATLKVDGKGDEPPAQQGGVPPTKDGDSSSLKINAVATPEAVTAQSEGEVIDETTDKKAEATQFANADSAGTKTKNIAKAEDPKEEKKVTASINQDKEGGAKAGAEAQDGDEKNDSGVKLDAEGNVEEISYEEVKKNSDAIVNRSNQILTDAADMGAGDAVLYSDLNHDNASAIGNLLGGEDLGWSDNGYTMTSEQAATLKNLYGITFDSANQQIRFSGKEDDFGADIMNYINQLSSVNGGKGYQSLLQDHAQNTNQYRYRQYAIDAAQVKVDEAQAKVKKLIVTKGTQKEIQKAREELGEAQKALGKAKEDGKGDIDKYNATITELDSIVTAAKKNYTIAKSAALSTAENFFRNDTVRSNQFADAINSSDFETARSLAYDALNNKTISSDEFEELNNKIATVEGTKAEADAKEAEVNQVQQGAETPREVDLQDLVRIGTVAMTPFVTETELALRKDVNVLAGEIGAAVGTVDDTALSDVDVDASMPSTVSGSAMVVAELLKNANVDLKLLDETFEEEEAKTVVQTGTLAGAGSQAGTSASLEVPEEEKEEKPEDEKKYLTDEQVALIQAKRQMLLKQYVNAAVQISEGMNAVSNKFADRANVLISFSEGVQNEAGAFGLTQDVGRYVLLESLRAVALSSAQMGVQAARLLNEREVDNEIQ